MPDTYTAVLGLTKPEVGGSTSTWGTKTNDNWDALDALFEGADVLKLPHGGTGAVNAAGARTNLGLGTMAVQNAAAVAITGGTMSGVTASFGATQFSGQVHSTSGGFKFPDGSVQTVAASGGGGGGGLSWNTRNSNFTAVASNGYVVTAAGVQMTLPTGGNGDTIAYVKTTSSLTCTIVPAGGQTIMGASSLTVDLPYAGFSLVCFGGDWRIY